MLQRFPFDSIDKQVRARLTDWPNQPPGLRVVETDAWLRARPDGSVGGQCVLKLPGSHKMRTLPDGLWINFRGSFKEPYVDIFAIEACTSLSNLLDKRSRFAPSTQSLMAVCPVPWLMAPVTPDDGTPRWRATGVLQDKPTTALVLPVRICGSCMASTPSIMAGLRSINCRTPTSSSFP